MANRHYRGDDEQSAFIEVDLLPHMRRPRAFNVNILLIVLAAVFFSWVLIYIPLNGRQNALDDTLERNNDLTNQQAVITDIIDRYGIERERIEFQDQLALARPLQSEYADNLASISQAITIVETDGRILSVSYSAVENQFDLIITLSRNISFQNVNIEFLELDFVQNSSNTTPEPISGSSRYRAAYTIEVIDNAIEESE